MLLLHLNFLQNLLLFISSISVGRGKLQKERHSSTMSLLFWIISFKISWTQSKWNVDQLWAKSSTQAHRRMGRHLLFTNWRVGLTSSEASLPTLPKIAFVDRLNERLAFVTEHLNCRPLIMYVPKYRISLTKGRLWPFKVDMLAHFTSRLGPIRIQHDFLVLIHISKQNNSNSQAWKRRCNSLTDGAYN